MPTLLTLWANPWIRRAALLAAIVAALLIARAHYIGVGEQSGKQDAAQQTAQQIEQARRADRAQLEEKLALVSTQIAAAEERARADRALFVSLVAQRQQAKVEVQGMTEAQVQAIVERYSPRQLADCVTQLPLCERQVETLKAEAAESEQQLAGREQQLEDLAGYNAELEQLYTQLWNVKAVPVRSWKCLKLWRCTRPQIPMPKPELLRQLRTSKK